MRYSDSSAYQIGCQDNSAAYKHVHLGDSHTEDTILWKFSRNWQRKESEQRIRQQEVREGLRTKASYLMYRYGFTEEQAIEELEKIRQEKMEAEKSLFNQQQE